MSKAVRLAENVQSLDGLAGQETPGVVVTSKQATPSEPSRARCKSGQVSAAGVNPTAGGLRSGVAGGNPARGWRPIPLCLAWGRGAFGWNQLLGRVSGMTDVFITRGGRAHRGIQALRSGPLRTAELGVAMGVPTGRVHAYMRWALDAGAVAILKRGSGGPGNESIWSIGSTPTVLGGEHPPQRPPVHVVPKLASVFAWRP